MKFTAIRLWLQKLSFRTGVIVLALCVPCYLLSFAPLLTDMDASYKAAIWTVMFGMAKLFQYSGLTIIGAEGISRIRKFFKNRRSA